MGRLNAAFLEGDALRRLGFRALGRNVRIHQTAVLADCSRLELGDDVRIDAFAVISVAGGLRIGCHVHVGSHAVLTGGAEIEIGDFAGLSHGVQVFSSSEDYSGAGLANPTVPRRFRALREAPVRVGRHGLVGAGSILLPGARLEEGAAVGALSLVDRRLEEWGLYAGIPARRLRARARDALRLEERLRAEQGDGRRMVAC